MHEYGMALDRRCQMDGIRRPESISCSQIGGPLYDPGIHFPHDEPFCGEKVVIGSKKGPIVLVQGIGGFDQVDDRAGIEVCSSHLSPQEFRSSRTCASMSSLVRKPAGREAIRSKTSISPS